MTQSHKAALRLCMAFLLLACLHSGAFAGQTDFCVICTEPERNYVCRVDTPRANPGEEALRLYCIVRTAKDGGHRSCSVSRASASSCTGPLKTYSYTGPAIPDSVRSAIRRYENRRSEPEQTAAEPNAEGKEGPPDTLVEMTGRAGSAVKDAAAGTGRVIGKGAQGAGSAVGKAAKKTGSAVGNAARFTYNCIRTLFMGCGDDEDN